MLLPQYSIAAATVTVTARLALSVGISSDGARPADGQPAARLAGPSVPVTEPPPVPVARALRVTGAVTTSLSGGQAAASAATGSLSGSATGTGRRRLLELRCTESAGAGESDLESMAA